MINEFAIGAYRGLKDLELKELKRINVFVGPNNCGKTSLLEAIILSGLFEDVELLLDALVSRYQGFSAELFESLFPINYEPLICLKAKYDNGDKFLHTHITSNKTQTIGKDTNATLANDFELHFDYGFSGCDGRSLHDNFVIRFEEEANNYRVGIGKRPGNSLQVKIPCKFISFSRFDRSGRFFKDVDALLDQNLRQELIGILKIFDERIVNFELTGTNRTIKLFRTDQEKPLALFDYGNGMYKAFYIATAALLAKNGILLIDEIEAGIHNKALKDFIGKLMSVCIANNVQLFLTTHSLEAIDILLAEGGDQLDDMAIYHIKESRGYPMAKRYSGRKLLSLRNEIGFDVR